jgi:tRNA(Leu) C34 or U34 (ribose-2'-O)-methylase TrmL
LDMRSKTVREDLIFVAHAGSDRYTGDSRDRRLQFLQGRQFLTRERFLLKQQLWGDRDQAGPGSARIRSLNLSHSVAVQISVWA